MHSEAGFSLVFRGRGLSIVFGIEPGDDGAKSSELEGAVLNSIDLHWPAGNTCFGKLFKNFKFICEPKP